MVNHSHKESIKKTINVDPEEPTFCSLSQPECSR